MSSELTKEEERMKKESREIVKRGKEEHKVIRERIVVEETKVEIVNLPKLKMAPIPKPMPVKIIDETSLPFMPGILIGVPAFSFSRAPAVGLMRLIDLEIKAPRMVMPSVGIPFTKFLSNINVSSLALNDIINIPRAFSAQSLAVPRITFMHPISAIKIEARDECKFTPLIESKTVQKLLIEEEVKDAAEMHREDLFELLFEWESKKELERFYKALSSPRTVCVIFEPKDFPGELAIRRILATEFKRAYGEIEAEHDASEKLSDRSVHALTLDLDKIYGKIREETDFAKSLNDLMSEMGIDAEAVKLIMVRSSGENANRIREEMTKRGIPTFILRSKYGKSVPKDDYEKIIRAYAWLLSIDQSESDIKSTMLSMDLDGALGYLDIRRIDFVEELSRDEDVIHVCEWEGESEEHYKLKLLAYKTLKMMGYRDEEIRVERTIDGFPIVHEDMDICYRNEKGDLVIPSRPIPDLCVDKKVWVEIETLRGIKDPLPGLIAKFRRKISFIADYEELWIVIPSFEVAMHYNDLYLLPEMLLSMIRKAKGGTEIRTRISLWRPDLVNRRIRKLIEKTLKS